MSILMEDPNGSYYASMGRDQLMRTLKGKDAAIAELRREVEYRQNKLDTYKDCFEQLGVNNLADLVTRHDIQMDRLQAERDSLKAEVERAKLNAKSVIERLVNEVTTRVQYPIHAAVCAENDSLKAQLAAANDCYATLTDALWAAFGSQDRRDYAQQAKEIVEALAAANARIERLTQPVSDEEWPCEANLEPCVYASKDDVDALIAARAERKEGL